jgi:hypothetical protein
VKDEAAKRRWIHWAKMKGNLYSFKACLCGTHRGAPWGDTTRVAGLLGRAKENGFRINAHKVGAVVNSRGGGRLLDHSWHERTLMPARLCRPDGAGSSCD